MRRDRPTISDIARRAGVSVGTVSNVFNGKGRFSDVTRSRVLEVAADLHFVPNALIRSLQQGKTNTIGVITWGINGEPERGDMTMLLLKGLADGIGLERYDTLLYSNQLEPTESKSASAFLDGRIDALIVRPGGLSDDTLGALAESGLAVVALYQAPVHPRMGAVNIDNAGGTCAAVEHLIGLGHRRIAFYAPITPFDFAERMTGYVRGLVNHGIEPDPELSYRPEVDYRTPVGAACDHFLALPSRPSAVIAGDDVVAIMFVEEFARRGVRVPEDMSVVGFNDSPAARSEIGLTTLRQPVLEVGETAARFAARLIEGAPAEECRAVLPVELVVRGTTGLPRKAAH